MATRMRQINSPMIGQGLAHYQITSLLGVGGMGEVYRARDTRLGREVAIKVLPASFEQEPDRVARFEREARILASLNHPHIASVFGFEQHGGKHFLVLELIEGETLQERLQGGALSLGAALEVAQQMAEALEAAHGKGIIHRDLKPANVQFTAGGKVKVLDFGLAKAPSHPLLAPHAAGPHGTAKILTTLSGAVMGTPGYMSPEQADGQQVDARSDIFSFGAVLYELLTGQRAFHGDSVGATLSAVLRDEPKPLRELAPEAPPELETIVTGCLRKVRTERLQTMKEVVEALRRIPRESKKETTPSLAAAWLTVGAAFIFVLALVGGFLKSQSRQTRTPGKITALAVKPLDDFSGDTNNAYLSDGMTEALCAALGNISALRVPGRSSVMRYKGGQKSISEMGQELKVDAIVEGSIQHAGNRMKIIIQLVEVATDRHLWSTNFERDLGEFFQVQSEVARAIAAEVQVRLTPEDQARLARVRVVKPEVLDAALKGRFHFLKYSMAGVSNALVHFHKAVELDPTYAPAYSGLADCYGYSSGVFISPREGWPKAKAYAQKALELDDSLADAYAARGMHRFFGDWDWKGAEEDLLHALKLSPNAAHIHDFYGSFLGTLGRLDEAHAQSRRAIELEPLVPSFRVNQALWHYSRRDYPQAIARLGEALEIDANSFVVFGPLAWAYLASDHANEALQAFEKCAALEPDNPVAKMGLACGEVAAGKRAEAMKRIEELNALSKERYAAPMLHAYFHAVARETDEALRDIERGLAERDAWILSIKMDPVFDALRSHPRFVAVLKKINFPP